jgi:iron(III) transport system substrate-binding protein
MTQGLPMSVPGRVALTAALAMVLIALAGCASDENVVVVYSSQDQVFAEPIFQEFTRQTGIEVRPVFDMESAKTAGLANRLRLERSNPQCDVFWSNEELHARLLAEEGVLSSNGWRTVGYRTRRIVLNTNQLAGMAAPKSLLELTNAAWRGKFAMAYPLFGTTGLHLQALRQSWGEPLWKQWCEGVVRNGAKIVDGNSMVVKLVGSGEAVLGLTDSDDVAAGQAQGFPIGALDPGPEMLAIPNTVALVRGAPRSQNAEALAAFLAKPETLQILVAAHALESASFEDAPSGLLKMRWAGTTQAMKEAAALLQQIFVRS